MSIKQLMNQKPGHPFCQFYHEAIDTIKITINFAYHYIKKSATEALNSETDASQISDN